MKEINGNTLSEGVDPVPVTQIGLTTYSEAAPAAEEHPPPTESILDGYSNPYVDQTAWDMLTRSYKVGHFDWAYTTPENSWQTLVFPDALFTSAPKLLETLQRIKYIRADVEWEVKLNATRFHIGALQVGTFSSRNSDYLPLASFGNRQNLEHRTVMKASEINSAKGVLRRTYPLMWDEIRGTNYVPWSIGTMYLDIRDKLLSLQSGSPSDVTVCVYARLVNVHIAGYGYHAPDAARLRAELKRHIINSAVSSEPMRKKGKTQKTNPSDKEGEKKSERGIISGIAEAAGALAPFLLETPVPELAPIAYAIGKTAPFFRSLGLCKPVNQMAIQPVSHDPYRDLIPTHGMSQGLKLTCHPDAMLGRVNLCELQPHKIKDLIMMPCRVAKFTLDATTPIGETQWHKPINPGMSWSSVQYQYYPTFLAHISQFFSRWKGSMKLMFDFTTSEFTTTRIRLTHYPDDQLPPSGDEALTSGDFVSEVIDIRGNMSIERSFPHLSKFPTAYTGGFFGDADADADVIFNALQNQVMTWVGLSLETDVSIPEPGGVSTIYVNVYAAAAEDFQFFDYVGWQVKPPASFTLPAARAQLKDKLKGKEKDAQEVLKKKSHTEIFSKPFRGLVPFVSQQEAGLTTVEWNTTVEELMKRFTRWWQTVDFTADSFLMYPLWGRYDRNLKNQDFFEWSRMFAYWRGSERYKLGPWGATKHAKYTSYGQPNYPVTFNGFSEAYTNLNVVADSTPPLEYEVPWTYPWYAMPTWSGTTIEFFDFIDGSIYPLIEVSGTDLPTHAWMAVGEDYMFGQVQPPHLYNFDYAGLSSEEPMDLSKSSTAEVAAMVREAQAKLSSRGIDTARVS